MSKEHESNIVFRIAIARAAKGISKEAESVILAAFLYTLDRRRAKLISFSVNPIGVDFTIKVSPSIDVPALINTLKSASSLRMRNRFPRDFSDADAYWLPGYYIASVGAPSDDEVRAYIERRFTPAIGSKGKPAARSEAEAKPASVSAAVPELTVAPEADSEHRPAPKAKAKGAEADSVADAKPAAKADAKAAVAKPAAKTKPVPVSVAADTAGQEAKASPRKRSAKGAVSAASAARAEEKPAAVTAPGADALPKAKPGNAKAAPAVKSGESPQSASKAKASGIPIRAQATSASDSLLSGQVDLVIQRSADECEVASDLEQVFIAESIKKTLRDQDDAPADFDGLHCVDCHAEIPEKRLEMGKHRCVSCQQIIERDRMLRRSF